MGEKRNEYFDIKIQTALKINWAIQSISIKLHNLNLAQIFYNERFGSEIEDIKYDLEFKQNLLITPCKEITEDVKPLHTVSNIESLPFLMTIEETFLLILIYRPLPGSIPEFVQSLEIELFQIRGQIPPRDYRTLILGDFNLPQNKEDLNGVLPPETFHQRCHYSTHIDGNILDLVFDDKKSEPVKWISSP